MKVRGAASLNPCVPPEWTKEDSLAFKALSEGVANAGQQKRALDYVVRHLAATYDLSYRPNDRDTAFAEGRRFVGLQIVKLVNLKLGNLPDLKEGA